MLDDLNVIQQRDPGNALNVAKLQYEQASFAVEIINKVGVTRPIENIVIAGMGGSALAAILLKTWLKPELKMPMEIVRTYDLPAYVDQSTLFVASSYSGNTEETVSCLEQAAAKGAQVVIIASGGKLLDYAKTNNVMHVQLPSNFQPRMAMIYNLCALISMFVNFEIVSVDKFNAIRSSAEWLKAETSKWANDVPIENNYAKQLALQAVGKTAIFYGGTLTAPVAYKWKISFNENAKNVAFCNELPEYNHNELLGWTSHPVEKPFVVFDIVSKLEHPRILKRFEITDKLLSGMRPKAIAINLPGETDIQQLLWGSILADFVSIYVAILNGVDPTPVPIIEKLKVELV
jgi:glucose/mannose-6-phosphate isomerase